MLERDIGEHFKEIFNQYPILLPDHRSQAGWPDRLIQLPDSRVIAVELKRVEVNTKGYFLLSHLRQEQCAWLAKWQRNGGSCFVFCGVTKDNMFMDYCIVQMASWNGWLIANKHKYYLKDWGIWNDEAVLNWFEGIYADA